MVSSDGGRPGGGDGHRGRNPFRKIIDWFNAEDVADELRSEHIPDPIEPPPPATAPKPPKTNQEKFQEGKAVLVDKKPDQVGVTPEENEALDDLCSKLDEGINDLSLDEQIIFETMARSSTKGKITTWLQRNFDTVTFVIPSLLMPLGRAIAAVGHGNTTVQIVGTGLASLGGFIKPVVDYLEERTHKDVETWLENVDSYVNDGEFSPGAGEETEHDRYRRIVIALHALKESYKNNSIDKNDPKLLELAISYRDLLAELRGLVESEMSADPGRFGLSSALEVAGVVESRVQYILTEDLSSYLEPEYKKLIDGLKKKISFGDFRDWLAKNWKMKLASWGSGFLVGGILAITLGTNIAHAMGGTEGAHHDGQPDHTGPGDHHGTATTEQSHPSSTDSTQPHPSTQAPAGSEQHPSDNQPHSPVASGDQPHPDKGDGQDNHGPAVSGGGDHKPHPDNTGDKDSGDKTEDKSEGGQKNGGVVPGAPKPHQNNNEDKGPEDNKGGKANPAPAPAPEGKTDASKAPENTPAPATPKAEDSAPAQSEPPTDHKDMTKAEITTAEDKARELHNQKMNLYDYMNGKQRQGADLPQPAAKEMEDDTTAKMVERGVQPNGELPKPGYDDYHQALETKHPDLAQNMDVVHHAEQAGIDTSGVDQAELGEFTKAVASGNTEELHNILNNNFIDNVQITEHQTLLEWLSSEEGRQIWAKLSDEQRHEVLSFPDFTHDIVSNAGHHITDAAGSVEHQPPVTPAETESDNKGTGNNTGAGATGNKVPTAGAGGSPTTVKNNADNDPGGNGQGGGQPVPTQDQIPPTTADNDDSPTPKGTESPADNTSANTNQGQPTGGRDGNGGDPTNPVTVDLPPTTETSGNGGGHGGNTPQQPDNHYLPYEIVGGTAAGLGGLLAVGRKAEQHLELRKAPKVENYRTAIIYGNRQLKQIENIVEKAKRNDASADVSDLIMLADKDNNLWHITQYPTIDNGMRFGLTPDGEPARTYVYEIDEMIAFFSGRNRDFKFWYLKKFPKKNAKKEANVSKEDEVVAEFKKRGWRRNTPVHIQGSSDMWKIDSVNPDGSITVEKVSMAGGTGDYQTLTLEQLLSANPD